MTTNWLPLVLEARKSLENVANRALCERLRDAGQYCHEFEIKITDEHTEQSIREWVRDMISCHHQLVRVDGAMHLFLMLDNDVMMTRLAFSDAEHGFID